MRSVPEWIGETDDVMPPVRVRARIFAEHHGICQCGCGVRIAHGDRWVLDHQIALSNGGENREGNLQPMLHEHHKTKTRSDMKIKAKGASVRAKHLGLKKPRQPFATNKDQPWKKKIDGTVERRTLDRHGRKAVKRAGASVSTERNARAGAAPAPASPWRSLVIETERLKIDRMLWPLKDHLAALNDRQHMRFSEQRRLVHTYETQEAVIAESLKSEHTQYPRLMFHVWIKQPGNSHPLYGLAGSLSVDLDLPNKRADMGVMLLPRWERKGIGLEAWKGLMQHLIEKEGIRKIEAGFMASHVGMQQICINSGMVFEGRRESHFDVDGAREPVLFYGAAI